MVGLTRPVFETMRFASHDLPKSEKDALLIRTSLLLGHETFKRDRQSEGFMCGRSGDRIQAESNLMKLMFVVTSLNQLIYQLGQKIEVQSYIQHHDPISYSVTLF